MTDQTETTAASARKPGLRTGAAVALLLAASVGGVAIGFVSKAYIDRSVERSVAAALTGQALGERVERLVREKTAEAIRAQPQVIAETLKTYIEKQQEDAQRKDERSVLALAAEMRDASGLPTRGPADAKATVVYFFDSNCPYCKQMEPILKPLAETGKVRVIYREIPILGPGSETAARFGAALYKVAPEKWQAFHVAVMAARGHVDDAAVMRLAVASAGEEAVGKAMGILSDPQAAAPVKRNLELAQRAGIHGTPFILVGDTMFRGAVSAEQLAAAIAKSATAER